VRQLLEKEKYENIKRTNTEETPMMSRVLMNSTVMLIKNKYDAALYMAE